MAESSDIPSWILLFLGIYSLGASMGELRQPGFWKQMMHEVSRSKALQFLTGIVCLALGAAIYLASPYDPTDWVSILVTVLAAWMVVEGLLFLALGDWMTGFAAKLMGTADRMWAGIAALLGLAMIVLALTRLL